MQRRGKAMDESQKAKLIVQVTYYSYCKNKKNVKKARSKSQEPLCVCAHTLNKTAGNTHTETATEFLSILFFFPKEIVSRIFCLCWACSFSGSTGKFMA